MNALVWITRRLRGKPAAGITKPFLHPKKPAATQHAMNTFFHPSQLAIARPLMSAEVDALDIVFSSQEVVAAAGRLNFKRTSLLKVAGLRGAIAEAIARVVGDGDSFDIDEVSPAVIASVLDGFAACVDDEIAAALEDQARHNDRRRARLDRLAPLRKAVAALVTELGAEQRTLVTRLDAARRAATMTAETGARRHQNLIAMGLSIEQIAALGPDAADPEAAAATNRARIAEIAQALPVLQAFLDGDQVDTSPLAGFGLADLIEARRLAEELIA